jgi:hypothetical protein
VQMAVADSSETTPSTKTVALSLKLAPTDVQALRRSAATMGATPMALETEVDVVDATVLSAGQPTCADGQCLRVQMKFAPDTRTNPADQPEVQLLEDGDAISNRVKVVVKIDPSDLGSLPANEQPTEPSPAPDTGAPSVLSLPMPPATDPSTPAAPTTDTTTVSLPDGDTTPGTPEASEVQVEALLEVVQAVLDPQTPAPAEPGGDAAAAPAADDCP